MGKVSAVEENFQVERRGFYSSIRHVFSFGSPMILSMHRSSPRSASISKSKPSNWMGEKSNYRYGKCPHCSSSFSLCTRLSFASRDTAGQERFHTITGELVVGVEVREENDRRFVLVSYYRGATGIMLVYDVTQARSFENINKWLRNIEDHASTDVVKMLIGNKCDMEDKRCITRARGEALAREHNIPFFETSAKNNINVEKAFFEITRAILKKTPNPSSNGNSSVSVGDSTGSKPANSSNCVNCV